MKQREGRRSCVSETGGTIRRSIKTPSEIRRLIESFADMEGKSLSGAESPPAKAGGSCWGQMVSLLRAAPVMKRNSHLIHLLLTHMGQLFFPSSHPSHLTALLALTSRCCTEGRATQPGIRLIWAMHNHKPYPLQPGQHVCGHGLGESKRERGGHAG